MSGFRWHSALHKTLDAIPYSEEQWANFRLTGSFHVPSYPKLRTVKATLKDLWEIVRSGVYHTFFCPKKSPVAPKPVAPKPVTPKPVTEWRVTAVLLSYEGVLGMVQNYRVQEVDGTRRMYLKRVESLAGWRILKVGDVISSERSAERGDYFTGANYFGTVQELDRANKKLED